MVKLVTPNQSERMAALLDTAHANGQSLDDAAIGIPPHESPPDDDAYLERLAEQFSDRPPIAPRREVANTGKGNSKIMDFEALSKGTPPQRQWIIPQWLSPASTLLAGKGGVGKSLLSLQMAYALAGGVPLFGQDIDPHRVLYWACEDDHDELWRRLTGISIGAKLPLADATNLIVDARVGLENELFTSEYGRGMWTPTYALLQEQVNDYKADILIMDNIAHLFSGGENNRPAVTAFVNGIVGLAMDRPFCPIFLGHTAKADGSEFSGSTAWENAVRMRWFLSDKLPDQKDDPEERPADNIRYLSKRKTNYTNLDYLQMQIENGRFEIMGNGIEVDSTMPGLRVMRCKSIILASIPRILESGRISSDAFGVNYLPKQILAMGWAEGHTKGELHKAMMALFGEGKIRKGELGKDNARRPRFGLLVNS